MILKARDGSSVWAEVSWLPRLGPGSPPEFAHATKAVEQVLLRLWQGQVWDPDGDNSSGLVFPADLHTIRRVQTEPAGHVQVGYVSTPDYGIVAAVILHLDNAIGDYANQSVGWASEHFGVARQKVAFIRSLLVSKQARGLGLGRFLLRETVAKARELEAQAVIVHLRTEPTPANRLARAYQDAGFKSKSDEITVCIKRVRENRWVKFLRSSREAPCDPNNLEPEVHELKYVGVGTRVSVQAKSFAYTDALV